MLRHAKTTRTREAEEESQELLPLVHRSLAGSQSAMFDLVLRVQGRVFGLCLRMLGRREDAEEVAQESLLRMLRSLKQWDQARAFEPWLLAIAGNRCRTAISARKRTPVTTELFEGEIAAKPHETSAEPLAEEVRLALQNVRSDYREAFLLFHEQELSYGEIAEIMKVPLGTVKTWVHRARRELIDALRARGVVEENQHAMR